MEDSPIFNSVEEECCYWREKAKRYYQEKIDSQTELEDFTDESRQLEAELEATIEQNEKTIKALRNTLNQLQIENESQRQKLVQFENEQHTLDQLYKTVTIEKDKLKSYIRELEQKNDDLERAHRIVSESVTGIETMLNQAYEKNALLEIEVDEKELLQVKLQRLMDETRDLKQEYLVKTRPSTVIENGDDKLINNNIEINRTEIETQTTPTRKLNLNSSTTTINGTNGGGFQQTNPIKHTDLIGNSNVMTPSAKIAALNIVADLLRKVNTINNYLQHKKPTQYI